MNIIQRYMRWRQRQSLRRAPKRQPNPTEVDILRAKLDAANREIAMLKRQVERRDCAEVVPIMARRSARAAAA